jgi:hypothetical protein
MVSIALISLVVPWFQKGEIEVPMHVLRMFKSHVYPIIMVNSYNVSITTIIEYILLQNEPWV